MSIFLIMYVEVYETFFAAPFPARTAIQAGALPDGIAVEIECTAKKCGAIGITVAKVGEAEVR